MAALPPPRATGANTDGPHYFGGLLATDTPATWTTRLVFSGSRQLGNAEARERARAWVHSVLMPFSTETTLVAHGGATGFDTLVASVADQLHFQTRVFKPNWSRFGKRAGPLRNRAMYGSMQPTDVYVCYGQDGVSAGTQSFHAAAIDAGGRPYVLDLSTDKPPAKRA